MCYHFILFFAGIEGHEYVALAAAVWHCGKGGCFSDSLNIFIQRIFRFHSQEIPILISLSPFAPSVSRHGKCASKEHDNITV